VGENRRTHAAALKGLAPMQLAAARRVLLSARQDLGFFRSRQSCPHHESGANTDPI